jgi:D-alanyl-D-alanine carboxypeptidase (penicillin-binding protein 5/6)
VLAEHISGTVQEFSILMNEKAKELGATNSNFVNPNGVHNENHYSTAYDLSIISKYAMKNEMFRKLVSTTYYQLPTTNKYDREDRYFRASNELILTNNNNRPDNYYYKYATGIKTGFTTPAGNCLIASSEKDKLRLISVILGAGRTEDGLSQRYLDTLSLFDYGYSAYTIKEIVKKGQTVQTTNINNATRDTKRLEVVLQDDVSVLIQKKDIGNSVLPTVKLNDNLKAPVKLGDVIGTISYNVEDINYTYNLVAKNDVEKSKIFIKVLEVLFILFIIWVYLRIRKLNKAKDKKLKISKRYLK